LSQEILRFSVHVSLNFIEAAHKDGCRILLIFPAA